MAEEFDLYNRQRRPLGRTHPRGTPLPSGTYHVVVTGWIESEKGAFLMVRRAENATSEPGLWEAPGGCVQAGETSLTAVLREVREELGLEVDPKRVKLLSSERHEKDRVFSDVFLLRATKKLDELTVDHTELAQARWMMPAEIEQLHREGKLCRWANNYADIIYPE